MASMLKFGSIALLGAALAGPSHAQTALTYSSWVPPTHHMTTWLANWAVEAEKATGGRVKFTSLPRHPSAPPGTFDAIRDGLVDVSFATAGLTPARHVLPLMAELPGGGDTAEINSVAYSRVHWKHLQQAGEYKGVKLLGVFTHGPGQMFNTRRPINSLADLQGLKIRTGGGIAEKFGNLLGATAFVKPAPESYELLSSGIADGTFVPFESIVSFKLDTVIKYATVFPGGFYSAAIALIMNPDKWSKLPKQDLDAIEKLAYEHVARSCGKSWDAADQRGLEGLKKAGVRVDQASPAFAKEVAARAKNLDDDWIKSANAKGVDGKAALAEFRAELKKVAAERR